MKNLKKWFIGGTIFIILFGTLLHFVYEWSGNCAFIGIFGAVNESTWEHLKLLFWPAIIFSIFEYIYIGKDFQNYISAKVISIYVGIISIIIMFYTYTGIIGTHFLIIDILIFILSVVLSQYIGYKITTSEKILSDRITIIAIKALIVLTILFIVFTFYPPQLPLFED